MRSDALYECWLPKGAGVNLTMPTRRVATSAAAPAQQHLPHQASFYGGKHPAIDATDRPGAAGLIRP